MKILHLLIGAIGFAAFLATGLYMKQSFPAAYGDNEVAHMMFRANHIYLLLSAFINLALGLFLVGANSLLGRLSRFGASLLLLGSTPLFLAAFVLETAVGSFDRPVSYYAIVSTVVAMGMLCFSVFVEFLIERYQRRNAEG